MTKAQLLKAANHREVWMTRVRLLLKQVSAWAKIQGWKVERASKRLEDSSGRYNVPTLRLHAPRGELILEPVSAHAIGAGGRVDLEAYPTLNRVRLLADESGGWRIMTDSNVPLREPWSQETFIQLAADLLG